MKTWGAFLEGHRQLGSTTALVRAALGVDGYVVVHSEQMKKHLISQFTTLNPERVLTMHDIRNERFLGLPPRPVFIDACCMCVLTDKDLC